MKNGKMEDGRSARVLLPVQSVVTGGRLFFRLAFAVWRRMRKTNADKEGNQLTWWSRGQNAWEAGCHWAVNERSLSARNKIIYWSVEITPLIIPIIMYFVHLVYIHDTCKHSMNSHLKKFYSEEEKSTKKNSAVMSVAGA